MSGTGGDIGSAAFGGAVATASVGLVVFAGRMRKSDKQRARVFPPDVR